MLVKNVTAVNCMITMIPWLSRRFGWTGCVLWGFSWSAEAVFEVELGVECRTSSSKGFADSCSKRSADSSSKGFADSAIVAFSRETSQTDGLNPGNWVGGLRSGPDPCF